MCMTQLIGTEKHVGKKCAITSDCLEAMLQKGKKEYQVILTVYIEFRPQSLDLLVRFPADSMLGRSVRLQVTV